MYVSKLDVVIVNKNENIIYDSEGETRPVRPVLRKKKKKKWILYYIYITNGRYW